MEKIENEHVITWLNKEGIFISVLKPNLVVTREVAEKLVEAGSNILNNITRPALADIRNLKRMDNHAREYLETESIQQSVTATAFLTKTPIQNLIASFYLKFRNGTSPTKLFTDREKALRWLALFTQRQLN